MAIKKKVVSANKGYGKANLDRIRKHFNASGGDRSSDNVSYFKIKQPEGGGVTTAIIRVLPPWKSKTNIEGFFYYMVGQHFGDFSIGGRNRAIDCPQSVGRGNCIIDKFMNRLKSSGNKRLNGLGRRIYPNIRYYVNIIDRSDEGEGKVQVFAANKKFMEFVLDACEDVGDITSLTKGYDIIIKRRGQGLKTRYTYRLRNKPTAVDIDLKANPLYKLDEVISTWLTPEQMKEVLRDNYYEELKEVGMDLKKEKKVKNKPVDDDEEDNEDNEEEMEEEDTDEDGEDEAEDEDEEDDGEEVDDDDEDEVDDEDEEAEDIDDEDED